MKKIILLNGLPRAGKDTVADFIVDNFNYTKKSFASPMKRIISNTFGISLGELEEMKNNTDEFGVEIKVYPNNQPQQVIQYTNFREILQKFGTEGMKPEFGDAVWSDLLYNSIIKADTDLFVVADYRFMCEYQPQDGVEIIRILVKDKRELPLEGHASDVELYQNNVIFDYTIDNTGTLIELEEKVNSIIKEF